MTRAYLAFTDIGLALARRLADALPGSVDRCGSGGVSLAGWTALQFAQSDALVFVYSRSRFPPCTPHSCSITEN